jgi:hypothetical protein
LAGQGWVGLANLRGLAGLGRVGLGRARPGKAGLGALPIRDVIEARWPLSLGSYKILTWKQKAAHLKVGRAIGP